MVERRNELPSIRTARSLLDLCLAVSEAISPRTKITGPGQNSPHSFGNIGAHGWHTVTYGWTCGEVAMLYQYFVD